VEGNEWTPDTCMETQKGTRNGDRQASADGNGTRNGDRQASAEGNGTHPGSSADTRSGASPTGFIPS
jgi:hypothetical protein